MITFDYSAEAELFRRGFANRRTNDLGTDALRGRWALFASQSKSFQWNCSSVRFLKSTERDTARANSAPLQRIRPNRAASGHRPV
jgi:hypothetical protein